MLSGRARSRESPCPAAVAAVPVREQVDRPAQRYTHSGNLTGNKHGGRKAQDISEVHQVPVRRLGRVGAAASAHANVSMSAVIVQKSELTAGLLCLNQSVSNELQDYSGEIVMFVSRYCLVCDNN